MVEDQASELRELADLLPYKPVHLGQHQKMLRDAATEIERLRNIEMLARELVTIGMSLRFTSGPALSVIEKHDKSDPHYRLCAALELSGRRART